MNMQLKINQNLSTPKGKLLKDAIIEVADNKGIPLDQFWRNRLNDSAIDNCVEVITTLKKSKDK